MTTRECVHLVTGSYFRSRNKDGGHAMRLVVAENRMLHAHFTALYVIGDRMFTLQVFGFVLARWFPLRESCVVVDLVCSCNFDLDPYTNLTCTP